MLRTSTHDSFDQLRQAVTDRWQVPVLGVSLALLIAAFVRVGPPAPTTSFSQYVDQITALQRGEFYVEAGALINELLADDALDKQQRGSLYRLLAETFYLAEHERDQHDPENARRIVRNHRQALAMGLPPTANVYEQMGEALCWIDAPESAIDQFQKAIEYGSEQASHLRRQIIQLRENIGTAKPESTQKYLSGMLADDALSSDDLLWAVWQQVKLLTAQDKLDEVDDLLSDLKPRFRRAGLSPHLQYMRARRSYLTGDLEKAERLLLDLRGKVEPHKQLAAEAGWLLGQVHLADRRPREALAVFYDVVQNQPTGEYYLACRLGIAEALAALHHMDEAADAYEEVSGLAAHHADGEVVDRSSVRASLTSLYSVLRQDGRLEAALRFLRLASALVPIDDEKTRAKYLRMLGDLYVAIAERREANASATSQPVTWLSDGASEATSEAFLPGTAREAFREAAETYLRLSTLIVTDPPAAADAAWRAAMQFERANLPDRVIAVLEDFREVHTASSLLPEALHRLGQTLQSQGRYEEAIDRYAENLSQFPRTPSAMRSQVPMARCMIALGRKAYPRAEKALLTIIEQPTEKGRYSPEALEYREALFVLGNLYDQWGKSTQAITRLEEFRERYPDDPRIPRVKFVLASSYRKSGLALKSDRDKATSAARADLAARAIERLTWAEQLFADVVDTLGCRPFSSLSPIEQLYLKHSHMYQADCAFDMKQYERARSLYEETSRRFRRDPIALSACVQMLNCYQRLGKHEDARALLQRIKWLISAIPPESFEAIPGRQGLAYWQGFFDWVEKSGLF